MKNKKEIFRNIILFTGILLGIGFLIVLFHVGSFKVTKSDNTIGYIMTGSADEKGWNEMNYAGIKKACENYKLKLVVKENIKEYSGACEKAVEELINKKVSIIILSSNSYASEIKKLILNNKNVLFFTNAADFEAPNLSTYFVRMYQARYLSGIVAGAYTKTNEIGYIAAYNTSEVNRGISAFTLGVKRVNPDAKVIVRWTNAWDNERAEKQAVKDFAENTKVDVISYHQNRATVVYEAAKYGIGSIAYHTDESECDYCLASIVCDWSKIYENVLQKALYKTSINESYSWLGMEEGVLDLVSISDKIDNTVKLKVDTIKKQLTYGYNVFSGLIYDNQGNIRCNEDELISDYYLLEKFDWLVQGVEEYEIKTNK